MKLRSYIFILISFWLGLTHSVTGQNDLTLTQKLKQLRKDKKKRLDFLASMNIIYAEANGKELAGDLKWAVDSIPDLDNDIKIRLLTNIEVAYHARGLYDTSIVYSYKLLDLALQMKDSATISEAYFGVALNEEELRMYSSSIENEKKAILFSTDTLRRIHKINYLGEIYDESGDYENGGKYKQEAYNLFTQKGYDKDEFWYYALYNAGLGSHYLLTKEYEKSLEHNLKAFELITLNDEPRGYLYLQRMIAEANLGLGRKTGVLDSLVKSEKLARELHLHGELLELLRVLYLYYEQEEHPTQSLAYYKKYNHLEDSVLSVRTKQHYNLLNIRNQVQQKEYELSISQQKNVILKQKNNILWSILLLVGLVIAGSLYIIILRIKKNNLKRMLIEKENEALQIKNQYQELEKRQLEEDMDIKNKELSKMAFNQMEKNQMINELVSTIESDSDNKDHLIKQLRNVENIEQDWEVFKSHFDQVHEGFFKRLEKLSDTLTSKDIKYCAYIRMNLNAKEIASILGISHRTVEGIRSRIRKKLNLSSETDIRKFLSEL